MAINLLCFWIVLSPLSSGNAAEGDPEPLLNEPSASQLEFTLTPGLWLPRLGGDVSLGPGGTSINLENDLNVDSSEAVPNVELAVVKNNRWELDFSGFAFSADNSQAYPGQRPAQFGGLTLEPGDPFSTSFDITSVAMEVVWWRWQPYQIGPLPDGRECRAALRVGPAFGARYVDIDQTMRDFSGARADTGGEWLVPFVSINLQLRYNLPDSFPLLRTIEIDGAIAFGPALGGDGGSMTQLRASITGFVTPNLGLTFGYRLFELNVENEGYDFDAGLEGLFFAAALRF